MPALLCRGLGKLFTIVLGNSLDIQREKLVPLACEVDIAGEVSMCALTLAFGNPSALVE